MSGLILPTPGLLMGGKKKIDLIASSGRSNWGRSGDNPAPYTHTSPIPAANELLVIASGGRVGTLEGSARSTFVEINGGGNMSWLADRRSQGKNDDVIGGSIARANGPLTSPTITDRSPDASSRVDNYTHVAVTLRNAQSSSYIDGDAMTLDGGSGPYSLTVNVVNGGYVLAFLFIRNTSVLSWTNVSSIETGLNGDHRYGMAGTQTDFNGSLTVSVGPSTGLGYFVVVSYAPA